MSDHLSSADIAAGQDNMIATAATAMAPPSYSVDGGLDSSVAASASDIGSDFDHDEVVHQHVPWPSAKESPKIETRRASSDLADITEESDNDIGSSEHTPANNYDDMLAASGNSKKLSYPRPELSPGVTDQAQAFAQNPPTYHYVNPANQPSTEDETRSDLADIADEDPTTTTTATPNPKKKEVIHVYPPAQETVSKSTEMVHLYPRPDPPTPTPQKKGASSNDSGQQLDDEVVPNQNLQEQQPHVPMKFQYQPLDFEKDYYTKLFDFAKSQKSEPILPPKEAAQLFMFSSIPSDRLRMIWNMSVMPCAPYPPGVKPPPAMNYGQFKVAIRLIQLFQNRVTAKDEMLKVEKGVMLAPAYFAGVSGVVVPLPWKDLGQSDGVNGQVLPERRASVSSIEKETHKMQAVPTSNPMGRKMRRNSALSRTSSSGDGAYRRLSSKESLGSFVGEEKKQGSPDKGGGGTTVQPQSNRRESTEMVAYSENDGYIMSSDEYFTYRETFLRHCVTENNNGSSQHVYVDEAVRLFEKSGLDRAALGKLWDVVVKDADSGMLDEEEFVLMTHLIICVTRRNLPVPNELPSSLRNWRVNQFQGANPNQHQASGTAGATADAVSDGTQNKPHAPIGDTPSATGVESGAQVNRTAQKNYSNGESQRIAQMEKEIRSLRGMVDSLTTEVKELKDLIHNNKMNPFVSQRGGATNNRLGGSEHSSSRPMYDSASNDDVPNVDVEMYWGHKSDMESDDEPAPTYNYPNSSLGMHKPPVYKPPVPLSEPTQTPTEAPRRRPPSALRQSAGILRSSGASLRSNRSNASQSVRSLRMSQNIPSVHPSAARPRPRAQSVLPNTHYGVPQAQAPQMANGSYPGGGGGNGNRAFAKSMVNGLDGSNRSGRGDSSNNRVFAKSMGNGSGAMHNLATQMQQVQREEQFSSLIQKTKERLESDSGSLSGSHAGSKASGRKAPSNRRDSFKPAQLKPSHGQRRNASRRPRRASLVDSARHVIRRESGETEIYHEKTAPSTAAVDLAPL